MAPRLYSDDIDAAEREFSDATNVESAVRPGSVGRTLRVNLAWCKMSSADWPDAFTLASARGGVPDAGEREGAVDRATARLCAHRSDGDAPAPLAEALSAAAVGSRENADLYSPTAELIVGSSSNCRNVSRRERPMYSRVLAEGRLGRHVPEAQTRPVEPAR